MDNRSIRERVDELEVMVEELDRILATLLMREVVLAQKESVDSQQLDMFEPPEMVQ